MIDESTFRVRSWLNFFVVVLAVARLRSGTWLLNALELAGSIALLVFIVVGLAIYWLVSKWAKVV